MNRSKILSVFAATAVAASLLSACGGEAKSEGSSKDIVIGTSLGVTGALGVFGAGIKAGYEQYVTDVNDAGGLEVGGTKHKLVLKVLDNRSDVNTASQQTRELILEDKSAALLSFATPPMVVPAALVAEQFKIPFLASNTPAQAFQAGNESGWKYAWNMSFDETDQAKVAAEGLGLIDSNKKVALFTDTASDGVAERSLYKAAFKAAGLQVVGDYTFPVGTTDFSSYISDAKANGAQLLAAQMIPPDGIALFKQMKSLGFQPKVAFAAKASNSVTWPKAIGDLAQGTLSEVFWFPSTSATGQDQTDHLVATLGKKFPGNPTDFALAVTAYSAANVLGDAITRAGSLDAKSISAAIGKTNTDYPIGTVSFGDKNTAVTPYKLSQWQDGTQVPVLPAAPGITAIPYLGSTAK